MSEPFQPQGEVSQVAACLEAFRKLEPGDGITYGELAGAIAAAAGTDEPEHHAVQAAANLASKKLARSGERTVRCVRRYGYIRCTDAQMIDQGDDRMGKARRQVKWGTETVKAADPEQLDWQARQRRERMLHVQIRVAELEERPRRRPKA